MVLGSCRERRAWEDGWPVVPRKCPGEGWDGGGAEDKLSLMGENSVRYCPRTVDRACTSCMQLLVDVVAGL